MKVAILGGGGCFGVNLALYLLARGHDVVGLGRSALRGPAFTLGADRAGYRYHVYQVGPDNEFIVELLDAERPQVIVNFAAQGEGAASFKARNWRYFFETNTLALVDLSERLLGRTWLSRFVQVSTSESYGSSDDPLREGARLSPSSPYAASKAAFDLHLEAISRSHAFPCVVLRPSNCYARGQQLHRVVPKAFLTALTGRRMPLHGGGIQRKGYMAAEDLCSAIEVLMLREDVVGVYNAGPERPVSVRHLLELCADVAGRALSDFTDEAPDRTGQDACYWIDSSALRSLGWEPKKALEAGLAEVHGWVLEHLEALRGEPTDFRMRA